MKKFNKESSIVTEKKNQNSKKGSQRKRIICLDDSADSMESGKSSENFHRKIVKSEKRTGWTCPACTLLNETSCLICELCDCERPSSDVANQPTWTCQSCTYVNRGQNDICNMCGKLRTLRKTKQDTVKCMEKQQRCSSDSRAARFSDTKLLDIDSKKILDLKQGKSIQPIIFLILIEASCRNTDNIDAIDNSFQLIEERRSESF